MKVSICEDCIEYIDARDRFEELTVGPSSEQCVGCEKKGLFPTFRVDGHLGNANCGDCLTMTHCEVHDKIEGLYPWGEPREE